MRRAWLAAAVVAGCGYPSYAFEPDDGGAPVDANAGDTFADLGVNDAAPSDAGDDGAAETKDAGGDVVVTDIGVTDASDAVDAPTIGCAGSTALFCADFDTVTAPSAGWDGFFTSGGGTNTFDTVAHSPPSSFLSTLPVTSATEVAATIYKSFTAATPGATARIDAWLYIELTSDPDDVILFKLQNAGGGYGVGLAFDASGLTLETVGSPGASYPLGVATPTDRWIHFRMDAQLVTSAAHVTLWMDDMKTPLFDHADLSTATTSVTDYDLALGVYAATPTTTAIRVRFDDVSFDFR